ncbi:MAG: hypothetical protein ACYTFV_02540 [Planctomycetota bacterium]
MAALAVLVAMPAGAVVPPVCDEAQPVTGGERAPCSGALLGVDRLGRIIEAVDVAEADLALCERQRGLDEQEHGATVLRLRAERDALAVELDTVRKAGLDAVRPAPSLGDDWRFWLGVVGALAVGAAAGVGLAELAR